MINFKEFNEIIGLPRYQALEERYAL
jgi:hypothetical protein